MPRGVDECDLVLAFSTLDLAGVGPNGLRNSTSLASCYLGFSNEV